MRNHLIDNYPANTHPGTGIPFCGSGGIAAIQFAKAIERSAYVEGGDGVRRLFGS